MSKKVSVLFVVVLMLSLVLSACATPTAEVIEKTVEVEVVKTVEVEKVIEATPEPMKDRVQIYWYIGLGAGSQPAQIPLEKAFCDKFNASQDEIQLIPIIVDNKYARDNLTTQIAADNAPDIVGPVGTEGRASFPGAFLDLEPLIKATNYDTSDIDPVFLDFYKDQGKLVGLPFAIFPEAVFFNKEAFDEAGLAYPPQKYGEPYKWPDGKEEPWTFDTFTKLAKLLTVDANGNDATSPDFDATQIVQYGYVPQWTDSPRAVGTLFGAALPVDSKNNAVIPDSWKAAWSWYYEGMWGDQPFIPNQAALDSDLIKGNAFGSGKVAMATTHLWYTCCIDPLVVKSWDVAVMPSYNGVTTSKMHGDTFAIMAGTKHPEEAFKVYTYMLGEGSAELYAIYGGMPARTSQQADFFKSLDEKFAPNKVNWQVFVDSIPYMDVPNHQLYIPNYAKATDAFAKLGSDLRSNPDLVLETRFAEFQAELDGIFKEK